MIKLQSFGFLPGVHSGTRIKENLTYFQWGLFGNDRGVGVCLFGRYIHFIPLLLWTITPDAKATSLLYRAGRSFRP